MVGEFLVTSSGPHVKPYNLATRRYGSRNGNRSRNDRTAAAAPRIQNFRSRHNLSEMINTSAEKISGTRDRNIQVRQVNPFIVKATVSQTARFQLRLRANKTSASSSSGIQPANT